MADLHTRKSIQYLKSIILKEHMPFLQSSPVLKKRHCVPVYAETHLKDVTLTPDLFSSTLFSKELAHSLFDVHKHVLCVCVMNKLFYNSCAWIQYRVLGTRVI